jgi:hypothetical protein
MAREPSNQIFMTVRFGPTNCTNGVQIFFNSTLLNLQDRVAGGKVKSNGLFAELT